jgi:hypothetical protein
MDQGAYRDGEVTTKDTAKTTLMSDGLVGYNPEGTHRVAPSLVKYRSAGVRRTLSVVGSGKTSSSRDAAQTSRKTRWPLLIDWSPIVWLLRASPAKMSTTWERDRLNEIFTVDATESGVKTWIKHRELRRN